MLDQSESYNANFVACIIEIANKHSSYFQLDTNLISTSCLNSLQQTLGIILIEEYIIKNKHTIEAAPSAKRMKLSIKTTDEISLWIELAKLYRSINDYDSIKGIFTRNINLMTEYTRKALEHESNYDYFNALKCYTEAFDKSDWKNNQEPLEIEQELWEQSILRCCDELTDWKQMCEFSTRDTNLKELFMDSYSLEYIFPYAFKSKLKLILQEEKEKDQKKHQDLLDFIRNIENVNKQYLEQNYCLELALIYLHQKDFHAAKYYAQLCIEQYLQVLILLDIYRL
jgi:DNA-dependent protein kinase catalytic subunit